MGPCFWPGKGDNTTRNRKGRLKPRGCLVLLEAQAGGTLLQNFLAFSTGLRLRINCVVQRGMLSCLHLGSPHLSLLLPNTGAF